MNISTAADVRAWYAETLPADVTAPGARGRLAEDTVEAFNEAHPEAPYQVAAKADRTMTVEYVKVGKGGRKYNRKATVTLAEARRLTGTEGKRGRVSREAVSKALASA